MLLKLLPRKVEDLKQNLVENAVPEAVKSEEEQLQIKWEFSLGKIMEFPRLSETNTSGTARKGTF